MWPRTSVPPWSELRDGGPLSVPRAVDGWFVGAEPAQERGDGHEEPAAETAGGQLPTTGCLVGGRAADAKDGGGLFDGDGSPAVEFVEPRGCGCCAQHATASWRSARWRRRWRVRT